MKTRFTRSCETFGTVGELCSPCFPNQWSLDELIHWVIPGEATSESPKNQLPWHLRRTPPQIKLQLQTHLIERIRRIVFKQVVSCLFNTFSTPWYPPSLNFLLLPPFNSNFNEWRRFYRTFRFAPSSSRLSFLRNLFIHDCSAQRCFTGVFVCFADERKKINQQEWNAKLCVEYRMRCKHRAQQQQINASATILLWSSCLAPVECSGKETNSAFGTSLLSAGILVHLFEILLFQWVEESVRTELIAIVNFNLVLTKPQQIRESVSANEYSIDNYHHKVSAHTLRKSLMAESSRRVKLILVCFESSKQLKFEQIRDNQHNGFWEILIFTVIRTTCEIETMAGAHQNS